MKNIPLSSILGAVCLAGALSANAASTVSLGTTTPTVAVGSQITFDINIDFTGNPILGGGLDVFYTGFTDANQLTFQSYTPATNFGLDPSFGRTPDPQSTKLNGIGFTAADIGLPAFTGLTGPGSIGSITFLANIAGVYSLTLGVNVADVGGFYDINNQPLAGVFLTPISFNVTSTAVPEPASFLLFLSGLSGVFTFMKRQRKSGI
jgi:hypothetical protein